VATLRVNNANKPSLRAWLVVCNNHLLFLKAMWIARTGMGGRHAIC